MAIKAFSKQHIFDRVWNGLKEQGFVQSMSEVKDFGPRCAYRGDEGRKCAAGHLIPDEDYNPAYEGMGIIALAQTIRCDYGPRPSGFNNMEEGARRMAIRHLMSCLQGAHDCGDIPELMESHLRSNAIRHGLTIPGEEA